jgi:hypothetical protein
MGGMQEKVYMVCFTFFVSWLFWKGFHKSAYCVMRMTGRKPSWNTEHKSWKTTQILATADTFLD